MIELALLVLWWIIIIVVTFVFLLSGSVSLICWLHGNLATTKCCYKLPTFKMFPILTYLKVVRSICKQKYPRSSVLQIASAICKLHDKERISMLWFGFTPMVFFYKPETIEALLNNFNTITKSVEYDFLKPWLRTGLLTSTGNKWRTQRKLLTPTFHFQILENFISSFNKQASILTKKLESEVGKPWIDIEPRITKCTLDIICETAMGVHLNAQSGMGKEYVQSIHEIQDVFISRLMTPWFWFDIIFLYCFPSGWKFRKNVKRTHDFTRQVIKEKKEEMIQKGIERIEEEGSLGKREKKAFLELLLELHLKNESFTEENVAEEVDTFMFAGHDTIAMSMCWALYELGRHPEVQEKVFQELDSIFGYDKEREMTSEDLKMMKYLGCVIKESLRQHSPVTAIARRLTGSLEVNGYTLPPGCTCLVNILALHMDSEQFPQPDVFDPDRFLPENSGKRHPYAYIPFSAGPRNCIGQRFALMEEKTVLAHILRKFQITSLDPKDKIPILAGVVSRNAEPIRMSFALREKES